MKLTKKITYIVFIGIFLIALVLRMYKFGSIPNGLQQDETSLGYNAWSISKTLKDEHGVYLPQNFQAFGEYKLPGYIYASVLPVTLLGLSPLSIRLVSLLAGLGTIVLVYFVVKEIFIEKEYHWLPICSMFLLAINPWHIHFSRAAFEVMLASFFVTSGVYLFLLGNRKQIQWYYYVSSMCFVFALYTYNIARVFAPILFVFLFIQYRKKEITKKIPWGIIIFVTILLVPFVLGAIQKGGVSSTSGTLIHSSAQVQSQLIEFRSYFVQYPLFSKLFFNSILLNLWQYGNNAVSYVSGQFFFVDGGSHGNSSIGTSGYWYQWEFPLIILGMLSLLALKGRKASLVFFWILGVIAIASYTREAPQSTRSFLIVVPVTILSSLGFYQLIQLVKKVKNKTLAYGFLGLFIAISMYYVVLYISSYFVRFPVYSAPHWRTGDRDVVSLLEKEKDTIQHIILDKDAGLIYTSILVHSQYPPEKFQREAVWSEPDSEGFVRPMKFGNYEIREIDWKQDVCKSTTIVITKPDRLPSHVSAYHTISYPERPVVLNVGQEIFAYPTKDVAYVLVKGNETNADCHNIPINTSY